MTASDIYLLSVEAGSGQSPGHQPSAGVDKALNAQASGIGDKYLTETESRCSSFPWDEKDESESRATKPDGQPRVPV